ncbi:MAG: hypothetical protein JO328_10925 [Hyphomicrobiales bacterium]|nr:hypothetical protein [Hyphomicrobiales bacterium]MBV8827161.1 hypothetical protein [Hyphomicrobiales bacterium]MBV9427941.1 hypothetical protein [Bradyrhizobiaceae bacterium]
MDPTFAPSTSGGGVFDAVLGTSALPPAAIDPGALVDAGGAIGGAAGGLSVPVGPAAAPPPTTPAASGPPPPIGPPAPTAGGAGALDLGRILGAIEQQPSGFNTPRFMSSLGAGLSSAGQNWNKPAAAAFASGAGAALQGGQGYDNALQSMKLKALQTAIAAWKVGDIAAYHQALTDFRSASAQQRRPAASAAPAPPPPPAAPANNPPAGGATAARAATPDVIAEAKNAVARGASLEAVRQRALDHGFVLPAP